MYLAALGLFSKTADAKADEINGYYAGDDWNNYQTKVHALKSSAKIIGAAALSENARALELAANNSDLDFIHANTEALLLQYRELGGLLAKNLPR